MLLALVLAATDGGSSLSLAQVTPGDEVVYEIAGEGTLSLRACATSPKSIFVEVSAGRDGGAPAGMWLLDRMVLELPTASLDSPRPWLGENIGEGPMTFAGQRFGTCASFLLSHPTAHGPSGKVARCEAQALLLGGGLVHRDLSWLAHGAGLQTSVVQLKRVSNRKAPCSQSWPRVRVDGRFRWKSDSAVVEETLVAGSVIVRKDGSDTYLLDYLVDKLRKLPRERPTPVTLTFAGRPFEMLSVRSDKRVFAWPAPRAFPDAPLELRLRELSATTLVDWSSP